MTTDLILFSGSPASPARPDSRDGASSSSGSTTLSATSSPGGAGAGGGIGSGGEEPHAPESGSLQPSPRKKPRKQQLGNVREQRWSESEENLELTRRKVATPPAAQPATPAQPAANYIADKPYISLMSTFRTSWKAKHNHFLRYTDVKPKDERRPTVNELANQKYVLQKVNGWKEPASPKS